MSLELQATLAVNFFLWKQLLYTHIAVIMNKLLPLIAIIKYEL